VLPSSDISPGQTRPSDQLTAGSAAPPILYLPARGASTYPRAAPRLRRIAAEQLERRDQRGPGVHDEDAAMTAFQLATAGVTR
jgi:hypothetical protein